MSTYETSGAAPISPHQFRGMPNVPTGQQFGGVKAAVDSSSPAPSGAVGTLATFRAAANSSVL